MVRGVLRLAVAAILGLVTAGSMAVTGYLTLLERGMDQNLAAVKREVAAQRSIQAENAALGHMVGLTDSMGARLAAMTATAETLLAGVRQTAAANRAVLGLNGTLVANNGAAAEQLRQVSRSLDDMNQANREVGRSLEALAKTVADQKESLVGILWYATGMNAHTPEL